MSTATATWLDDVRSFVPATVAFTPTPVGTILIDIPEPVEVEEDAPVRD